MEQSRIGETVKANNGQMMTIIAYRNYADIDVQFEDGNIVKNREYGKFKKGQIRNLNVHIGETSISTKGQKMTVIGWNNSNHIDVKFEDGTIVKNTFYQSFKNGQITNPNFIARVGEEKISKTGEKMTIIAYRSTYDIDVQFEDGTIISNRLYSEFKKDKIKNPNFYRNSKIGEEIINKQGLKMKIIDCESSAKITVQFEDGTIVGNRSYYGFKHGTIEHPNFLFNNRNGMEVIANNGQKMRIIEYRKAEDIDVQFEDGTIVKNRKFKEFEKGKILNPNYNHYKEIIGKKYKLKDSEEEFEIIDYKSASNVTIKFANGFTRVTNMISIKYGIAHAKPNLHLVIGEKSIINGKPYYICSCKNCQMEALLSVEEINNHKCI